MKRLFTLAALIATFALSHSGFASPVGGPKHNSQERVLANDTDTYSVELWGGERTDFVVRGDGDTDLDLYVYDCYGTLIAKDDDYTDHCVVSIDVFQTGTFTVKIVNRGSVYNVYDLDIR